MNDNPGVTLQDMAAQPALANFVRFPNMVELRRLGDLLAEDQLIKGSLSSTSRYAHMGDEHVSDPA